MARFAIVDVNNLFYRAVRGSQGDAFTRAGLGLHITFRSLAKLVRDFDVDHIVVATEGRSWRYREYKAYKSRRRLDKAMATAAEREEELIFQEALNDMIAFMGEKTAITVLNSPNVEGDDFIARFVQLHSEDEHIILSSDSDFIQLLAPNVTLYDAMLERIITPQGVKNEQGDDMLFSVDVAKGKLKVGDTLEEEERKHRKEEREKKKADPEYDPKPFLFEVEPEWWRKALFIKIIRGDVSDSIFSAYPKVRYQGSSKKTGIREAWADRHKKGFEWNNFMQQTWEKLDPDAPEKEARSVTVKEQFALNERLIDLTQQPDDIIEEMDTALLVAIQKPRPAQVGFAFIKFCNRHQLVNLAKDASEHGRYLSATYPL